MICSRCNIRTELRVCPQCRIVKNGNFTRNRFAEDMARKIFQEEEGSTAAQLIVIMEDVLRDKG